MESCRPGKQRKQRSECPEQSIRCEGRKLVLCNPRENMKFKACEYLNSANLGPNVPVVRSKYADGRGVCPSNCHKYVEIAWIFAVSLC